MNNLNKCDEITELISLHLDGELDGIGQSRMRRHLTTCPACTVVFEELCAVDTLFHKAPVKYAPLGFTDRAVAAAFGADLRHNLVLGFLMLMLGTVIISGLFVVGRADLLWATLSILLEPAFFSSSGVWLAQLMDATATTVRVGLEVLALLRGLLIGPLLLPTLLSLLSGAMVMLVLRYTGRTPAALSA